VTGCANLSVFPVHLSALNVLSQDITYWWPVTKNT
jgi:hypothetical protein